MSFSTYNAFLNNPIFYEDPSGNDILPYKWYYSFLGFKIGGYGYIGFGEEMNGKKSR